ncbi:sarcosine dehydrogenase, mitochondrial [Hydra vulgaris]|uniref:sarcosine dehydrogenase, mitochondrial n=1 Tax=Hydra vulgaris TaxID=6087 RepID=UPI001F5EA31F|nr:sarcosine dehydrogenase, mitochondrial [Hydra vulgaris]
MLSITGKKLTLLAFNSRCLSRVSRYLGTSGSQNNKLTDDKPSVSLPDYADAVVIGGGSIGCSTAYHLTKHGMKNVVLIEKDQLSAGTTWHSAGLLWRLRPSDIEVELLAHTRLIARDILEKETGLSSVFNENGGLFIANNKVRLDEYKRLMTLGKVYGVESYTLSPTETKALYPLMNVNDIYGTLYSPGDGTIDPSGWTAVLSRAAALRGAKIVENCLVTNLLTEVDLFGKKKITEVHTNLGNIKTNCVINCAGAWAPHIGAMCGVPVPLVALRHAYVISERIEGIERMPNVRDHDASVYLRLQGDALAIGGYEQNPMFVNNLPNNFAFSLYDLDWDVFSSNINGAINRVPIIEKTGIKSTVCGPESFTADHKPLIGPDINVRGYYHNCGFNSAGIMLSGGCANELAKWVIHGNPDLDMWSYDIRRFHHSLIVNEKWNREKSHEAYAKNYSMQFPNDEPLASRNMRLDPFHQVLKEAGCFYQERHGWERPGWFNLEKVSEVKDYDWYGAYKEIPKHNNYIYNEILNDEYTFNFPQHFDAIGSECKTCREKVAVFNMSYFAKFLLTGPDASTAVDWIFTNNMRKPTGSVTYTCMLNEKGGIVADLTVSTLDSSNNSSAIFPEFQENGYYLAIGGAIGEHAWGHIQDVIHNKKFNVKLVDISEEVGMLSIQGPNSRKLLQKLTGENLLNDAFPFSTHKVVEIAGHKMRALRLTFVGEMGWELHIPKHACVDVYHEIMKVGKEFGIVNSGYRAIDNLSIEKGYRHWHADIRADDTPLEAGLAFTCKLKSDVPFLGREVLEKQKKSGLTKKLACFTIDEHRPLIGLEAIWRNKEIVGMIRRGGYGFHIGKTIGYGYVKSPSGGCIDNEFLKTGNYEIESMGEFIPAICNLNPLFDPENKRIKGLYS